MRKLSWPVWIILLIGGIVVAGKVKTYLSMARNVLPPEAAEVLHAARKGILYSVEPWDPPKPGEEVLGRGTIIGQTSLDAQQLQPVARLFEEAVQQWNGDMGKCFEPRHVLRINSGGHTYDFLLCYACEQMQIKKDGAELTLLGAGGSPDKLNAILSRAHVPLPRKLPHFFAPK